MGQRSILRDILIVLFALVVAGLLFVIVRQNDRYEQRVIDLTKMQRDQQRVLEEQSAAVQELLAQLKSGKAPAVQPNQPQSLDDARAKWEQQYADPKAAPGGTLYRAFPSDPGSLNPLTENDATVSRIYESLGQSLLTRDYKNPDIHVPSLATSWDEQQVSWGIPAKNGGTQILAQLQKDLPLEVKSWLKPSLEPDGRVRLEITKLGDDYLAEVTKIVPVEAFTPVQWVQARAVKSNQTGGPDAKGVLARFREWAASRPELKLSGEQVWFSEDGFKFRVPGGKENAENFVNEFLAQKEQQGPSGPAWSVSGTESFVFESKLLFTFTLRPGVRWNDGTPLKESDFVFRFRTMKDPGINCQATRNYFQDCESLEAPDSRTLRFTWRKLYKGAFEQSAAFGPLAEHIYHYTNPNDFNNSPHSTEAYGTGPYKLLEWKRGQRLVLVRNEYYWGLKPNFDRVQYNIIHESNTRLQNLAGKELDISELTPTQWMYETEKPPFGQEHGLIRFKQYAPVYSYIGWNLLRPELSDKRVRRALTMSIDREKILNGVLRGLGSVSHGTFFALGPYNDANIKPWPYDPPAAAKLFADAGWTLNSSGFLEKGGKTLRLRVSFPAGQETYKTVLIAAQDDLKKAGVQFELDPIEWAVLLERIRKRNFDAIALAWQLAWDPDPYQLWHSSQAAGEGSNHCSFANAEADAIIEQLRRTFETKKRIELCNRFDALLHDEQPYTFMFNRMDLYGMNADIQNAFLPLKAGETRNLYLPIFGAQAYSQYWWMPKQYQHK
ncbi:MAG TPA: ABC transporter substrate-binding protein [Planctomycetota bacterium]|jgi:peptide/nickel transport system substrate-binding protein